MAVRQRDVLVTPPEQAKIILPENSIRSSPMQIFDHEPADWSALQNTVGRLFEELGCEVAIGMRVKNVRGTKE